MEDNSSEKIDYFCIITAAGGVAVVGEE